MELQEILGQQCKTGFLNESLGKTISFAGRKAVNAYGACLIAPCDEDKHDVGVYLDGLTEWPQNLTDNYIIATGKLAVVDMVDISYFILRDAVWEQLKN